MCQDYCVDGYAPAMFTGGILYKHQAKGYHACIRKGASSCSSVSDSMTLLFHDFTMHPVCCLLSIVRMYESCLTARLPSCSLSAGWEHRSCKTSLGW